MEVPFLPRAVGTRRASRRWPAWAWFGLAVASALLLIAAATRLAKTRAEHSRDREIEAHLAAADEAEQAGHLDRALIEADAALALAHGDVAGLRDRRDRLSVRDAESRLAEAAVVPPAEVDGLVQALRVVRERSRNDEALAPLGDRIDEALGRVRGVQAESAIAAASLQWKADRAEDAIALCEKAMAGLDGLQSPRATQLRASARALVVQVVGRRGVVIAPIRGEFLQGPSSATAHEASLGPALADALRARGYVTRPGASAFAPLWDEAAPFRLEVRIDERNDGTYFQTPLRTTAIAAHLALTRSGTMAWQARASGKTRVPPPKMTAYEASHLALVKNREPELEKRLYDDAWSALGDGLAGVIRNLPSP